MDCLSRGLSLWRIFLPVRLSLRKSSAQSVRLRGSSNCLHARSPASEVTVVPRKFYCPRPGVSPSALRHVEIFSDGWMLHNSGFMGSDTRAQSLKGNTRLHYRVTSANHSFNCRA